MAKIISSTEYAKLHGISTSTLQQKLQRGNVPGAFKVGEGRRAVWCIPEDAPYIDRRIKVRPLKNPEEDSEGTM